MVRVEFTPEYNEFRRLSLAIYGRVFRPLAVAAGVAVAALLGAWLAGGWEPDRRTAIQLVVSPILSCGVIAYVILRSVRWRWDTAGELRSARVYEFDESGGRCTGTGFKTEFAWPLVKRIRSLAGHITLEIEPGRYHALPDRALTPAQRVELLELAHRHVGGTVGV